MTVTVSARGQIAVPSILRKRYGIKQNSKMEFVDTGKEIIFVPITEEDQFENAYGSLKDVSTEDLIQQRRKNRANEG